MTSKVKVMAYTLLVYSQAVSFYKAYQCSLIIPTTAVLQLRAIKFAYLITCWYTPYHTT